MRQFGWYRGYIRPNKGAGFLYSWSMLEGSMYQKVSTDMDFLSREKEMAAFWKEKGIIQKSFAQHQGKENRYGNETFHLIGG